MEKNYILGLDISTSTVGISCFNLNGDLVELNHVSPIIKNYKGLKHDELFDKSILISQYLANNYDTSHIDKIIIESPLISSKQFDTAALLNYFAGMVFANLKKQYPYSNFDYITVDEARRFGLPELVGGKNKSLFGNFPKKFNGIEITDLKKMVVLSSIAQRFPDVVWLLNNNLTIDKKNFDRADSIVVVLGYMQKNIGSGFAVHPQSNVEQTHEFIKKNIAYEKFIKTLDGKTPEEKNKAKYSYLKTVFEIEKFINVAI